MPYITKERAKEIYSLETRVENSENIITLLGNRIDNPGELNYVITSLLVEYVLKHSPINYALLSVTAAQAMHAGKEFERRVLNLYEDEKIKDVYNNVDPYELLQRSKK